MSPTALISGAGIAGPVVAHRLARAGWEVTVVERRAGDEAAGGHAVDVAGAATEALERMGVLDAVRAARVHRDGLEFHDRRGGTVRMSRLTPALGDRHVEIQRDDLIRILREATAADVELRFGDELAAVTVHDDGVEVAFVSGASGRFDVVIGADGLHSATRRLVFGPEAEFARFLGGYLAVYSYPSHLDLRGRVAGFLQPDAAVFTYPIGEGATARLVALFRREGEFGDDHRDVDAQRRRVRELLAGAGWEVPSILRHLDDADDFYFDSITQIRMPTWTRGRVALVGDAGYSPGPAVGGGTSLAIFGGFVVGERLARAAQDPAGALLEAETAIRGVVESSRDIGPNAVRRLVPGSPFEAWLTPRLLRAFTRLPDGLARRAFGVRSRDERTLDDFL